MNFFERPSIRQEEVDTVYPKEAHEFHAESREYRLARLNRETRGSFFRLLHQGLLRNATAQGVEKALFPGEDMPVGLHRAIEAVAASRPSQESAEGLVEQALDATAEEQKEKGYAYADTLRGFTFDERNILRDHCFMVARVREAFYEMNRVRRQSGKESTEYQRTYSYWKNLKVQNDLDRKRFTPALDEFYREANIGLSRERAQETLEHVNRFIGAQEAILDANRVASQERKEEQVLTQREDVPHLVAHSEVLGEAGKADGDKLKKDVEKELTRLDAALNRNDIKEITEHAQALVDAADNLRQEGVVEANKIFASTAERLTTISDQNVDPVKVELLQELSKTTDEQQLLTAENLAQSITGQGKREGPTDITPLIDEASKRVLSGVEKQSHGSESRGLMSRLSRMIKRHARIFSAAGLLTLVAAKTQNIDLAEPAQYMRPAVKLVETVSRQRSPYWEMISEEAARYRTMPTLRSVTVGVNDYIEHQAVYALDAMGVEFLAQGVYRTALERYMKNFAEYREENKFTDLNKNTVEKYVEEFARVYLKDNLEQQGALDLYVTFKDFLGKEFGAAKVVRLQGAILAQYDKDLSSPLLQQVFQEYAEYKRLLELAKGRCDIFLNQQDGIFRVAYGSKLIDTYTSRAGFLRVPDDPEGTLKKLGYASTPDGVHVIGSVDHEYTTLRWPEAVIPYGAALRLADNGEVQYQRKSAWYYATGPEATFFDRDTPISPNKNPAHAQLFKTRLGGEKPLDRSDFFPFGTLKDRWDKNPFGPATFVISNRPERIHANPTRDSLILQPSHGCIALKLEDAVALEQLIKPGARFYIVSEQGKDWHETMHIAQVAKQPSSQKNQAG